MQFIIKKHADSSKRMFLTIIDPCLKGKKLEEGRKTLDLSSRYYEGEEKSAEEAEKEISRAYIIHFIGNESVKRWVKKGEKTTEIKGVKHAIRMN